MFYKNQRGTVVNDQTATFPTDRRLVRSSVYFPADRLDRL